MGMCPREFQRKKRENAAKGEDCTEVVCALIQSIDKVQENDQGSGEMKWRNMFEGCVFSMYFISYSSISTRNQAHAHARAYNDSWGAPPSRPPFILDSFESILGS